MKNKSYLSQDDSLGRLGLIVERGDDGTVRANVAHIPVHSPTGFGVGYGGSGPADLALSVLHALLPPISESEEEAQYELDETSFAATLSNPSRWSESVGPNGTRVSRLAWQLHQGFKWKFIATMPREGGNIPINVILEWIDGERKLLIGDTLASSERV